MAEHEPKLGIIRSTTTNFFATNMDTEYVINFKYQNVSSDAESPEKQLEKLLRALDNVGLRVEVRDGGADNLLIFVRVRSEQKLLGEIYRSRIRDWLQGIRPAAPEKETQQSLENEPLTPSERLRIVYSMMTLPESEGGAGITPKKNEWQLVDSIYPLHDHEFNKKFLKDWSTKWLIGPEDISMIRNQFGEKIAFYFAFLQSYFLFLVFPAAIGIFSHFFLPQYSPFFAVMNCLWSVCFVEYWKRQEVDLAVRWSVRGCSKMQRKRAEFVAEKEIEDPITGELVQTFPAWKRFVRQMIQVPFALISGVMLSATIACVFSIEIFIVEVYAGPLKNVLKFLPTVLLSLLIPTITSILTGMATWLTNFENYENQDAQEAALTRKIFIINFMTAYTPLFLTAFVYVPFGSTIVPYLDVLNVTVEQFGHDEKYTTSEKGFKINPDRLKAQMIYFVVTAQIVNLALEIVVPYIKRVVFKKAKEFQDSRKGSKRVINDAPEEKSFLRRVRNESELDEYDVTVDLREMVMQFGYLTIFSPIWPVTAISFVINNLVELRSDAAKIALEMKRPIPARADSIGPWIHNLSFLTWVGSMSTAALVYLFNPSRGVDNATLYGLLGSILLCEHIYFGASIIVRECLARIPSLGVEQERRERYLIRKRYLEESFGTESEMVKREQTMIGQASMEGSLYDGGEPAQKFWSKQKRWDAAHSAGNEIMTEVKGKQKKTQ